jgi:hypothetical protein
MMHEISGVAAQIPATGKIDNKRIGGGACNCAEGVAKAKKSICFTYHFQDEQINDAYFAQT